MTTVPSPSPTDVADGMDITEPMATRSRPRRSVGRRPTRQLRWLLVIVAIALSVTSIAATPSEATVVGPDERVRVNPTTTFPYNNIVNITTLRGVCSGFLISRDTVATAGHCLFDPVTGARVPNSQYRVVAARNGSSAPYGVCSVSRSWTPSAYAQSRNRDFDYAYLKVSCAPYAQPAGLGMAQLSSASGISISVAGYPYSRPGNSADGTTMWRAGGLIERASATRYFYRFDTTGGQSGAPMLRLNSSGQWLVVGIHTEGYSIPGFNGLNSGIRFTSSVVAALRAGINS